MGAVRKQVYNTQLMSEVDYSNLGSLKAILRNMDALLELGQMGDQVAMSIYMDLKTALGGYGMEQTTLTHEQILVIKLGICQGYSQREICEDLGMEAGKVRYLTDTGVRKISKMLEGGDA